MSSILQFFYLARIYGGTYPIECTCRCLQWLCILMHVRHFAYVRLRLTANWHEDIRKCTSTKKISRKRSLMWGLRTWSDDLSILPETIMPFHPSIFQSVQRTEHGFPTAVGAKSWNVNLARLKNVKTLNKLNETHMQGSTQSESGKNLTV